MRRLLVAGMVVGMLAGFALPANADPGDRDTTFNGVGFNTTSYGADGGDSARAIALLGTRKIVVLGIADGVDGSLTRYKANGARDPQFSGDGKLTFAIGTEQDQMGLGIGSDGKPVVTGRVDAGGGDLDFFVERFLKTGGIDSGFGGGDGIVTTDFGGRRDEPQAVIVQGSGKILVAGRAFGVSTARLALARYTPAGVLDTTFGGGDGKVLTEVLDLTDGRAMAVQPNGKIVVVGVTSVDESNPDMFVVRFNTDGTLDHTFSGDGKLRIEFSSLASSASAVAIGADGRIVIGGGVFPSGSDTNFALARVTPDGLLDHDFSGDGKRILPFGPQNDFLTGLVVQSSGRIIAGGHTLQGSQFDVALARFNSNGTLDNDFGTGGKVIDDYGNDTSISALRGYRGERVVAAITKRVTGTDSNAGAARYLAN